MTSTEVEKEPETLNARLIGGAAGLVLGLVAGYLLTEANHNLVSAEDYLRFALAIGNLFLTTAGGAAIGNRIEIRV